MSKLVLINNVHMQFAIFRRLVTPCGDHSLALGRSHLLLGGRDYQNDGGASFQTDAWKQTSSQEAPTTTRTFQKAIVQEYTLNSNWIVKVFAH